VWDEVDHLGIYQVHNEMDIMPPRDHGELDDDDVAHEDDFVPREDDGDAVGHETTGAFTSATGEYDTIVPYGYTDVHDAYYVRGEGDGPPRQELPQVFKQLVRGLAERHDSHWSQAVCDLFSLALTHGKRFPKRWRSTPQPRRPRDVTFGDGEWALTVLVMPGAHLTMLTDEFLLRAATGRPSPGNIRLVIAWDPVAGLSTADYFHLTGERYMRVPPAIFWKSIITNR
jgi:hypothetical protein